MPSCHTSCPRNAHPWTVNIYSAAPHKIFTPTSTFMPFLIHFHSSYFIYKRTSCLKCIFTPCKPHELYAYKTEQVIFTLAHTHNTTYVSPMCYLCQLTAGLCLQSPGLGRGTSLTPLFFLSYTHTAMPHYVGSTFCTCISQDPPEKQNQ